MCARVTLRIPPESYRFPRQGVAQRIQAMPAQKWDRRKAMPPNLLQCGGHRRTQVGRGFDAADACGAHGRVFVFGGALAAADDGTGVAHAAARRSGLAGDEADYRLLHVGLDEFGGALFSVAADFADENDGVGVGVVVEHADGVEERRADDRVATDADASGLADAEARQLIDGFIGQGAAAAYDADMALLVNAAGHDAD